MPPEAMANMPRDDGAHAAGSNAGHGCRYDGNDASRDDEPRDGKYASRSNANMHDGNMPPEAMHGMMANMPPEMMQHMPPE